MARSARKPAQIESEDDLAKAVCSVEGCERPRWAHGLCGAHNKRRAAGKPIDGPIRRKAPNGADPAALFWSHVDRSAGPRACWPWTGFVATNGYGHAAYRLGRRRHDRAHRVSYLLTHGELPGGRGAQNFVIMHTCDNRRCCNPAHLKLGTQKDNVLDARAKGRLSPPPDNRAVLRKVNDDVRRQIASLGAGGSTRAAIARATGLGWTTINRALKEAGRGAP